MASSAGGPAGVGSGVGSGVALGSEVAAIVGSALGLVVGVGDPAPATSPVSSSRLEDRERDEADEDEGDGACRPEADEHPRRQSIAAGRPHSHRARRRRRDLAVRPSRRAPRRHVERIHCALSWLGRLRRCRLVGRIWISEDRFGVGLVGSLGSVHWAVPFPLWRCHERIGGGLRQICGPSGTRVNWPYDVLRAALSRSSGSRAARHLPDGDIGPDPANSAEDVTSAL